MEPTNGELGRPPQNLAQLIQELRENVPYDSPEDRDEDQGQHHERCRKFRKEDE
jgi:hypothetical protein